MDLLFPGQYNLQAALIGVLMLLARALGDTFEECTGINNTFVASPTNCSTYIFCAGDNSYSGDCGDGTYFNYFWQTCDPPESVDCRLDGQGNSTASSVTTSVGSTPPPVSSEGPTTVPPIEQSTTPSTATSFVPTPIVVVTTGSPVPSVTTSVGSTPPPVSSEGPTTVPPIEQSTTPSSSSSSSTGATVSTTCPEVDDPYKLVFVPHTKSCSDYFICFGGVAIPMHCSAMLHFDAKSGRCDYPQKVKCVADPSTAKEQCKAHTVDVYPHPSNCNYFYYCKKGYLILEQCPFTFGWDYKKRACVAIKEAKCFNK